MAEKIFDAQVNYGWGLSLNMTGKAPAVAKRIFDTYADALAYANDVNDSAIEGLVLSVVADTAELNGAYFVQQVAKPAIEADEEKGIEAADAVSAVLVKLSSADGASSDTAAALQAAKDYTDQEVKELADGAVKTNTDAIAVLKGNAETEGSVAKAVADEKALREAAEKDITDRLDVIEGEAEGSVKKALADAKTYANTKVEELDATVTGASAHVSVEIVEENGKLTAVTVAETDIASADDLANEVSGLTKAINDEAEAAREAEAALAGRIKAIEDAPYATTSYVEGVVEGLDATVGSQTVAEGKHVAVEVVEKNGKLTAVTVVENDIASAAALTAETAAREAADTANANAITAETKARQDADTAINKKIGNVAEGKTVVEMIEAAATLLTEKATGHVTVSGVQDKTTGAWTYTIAENDIASASGVSAAISAETKAREDAIAALDATVTGEGTYVDVTVSQVDGVITAVTIAESDIASAAVLASVKEDVDNFFKDATFSEAAKDTLKELQEYITSDAAGALKMEQAIADNKKAIEDEVTRAEVEEGKLDAAIKKEVSDREAAVSALTQTVADNKAALEAEDAKLAQSIADEATKAREEEGKLSSAIADEKSRAEGKELELNNAITAEKERAEAAESGLTAAIAAEEARAISAETANANAITAEQSRATSAETALSDRLDVLEGVTVTGKDAIVVSESSAKASKKVSLKLGTQPAEGKAGIVLSQNENGLVADLYWGTF